MTPARKKINAKQNTPIMREVCSELGVVIRELNPNSYRLTKSGYATFDYYPSTNKVMLVGGKFAQIVEIREFVAEMFAEEKGGYQHKKEKRCTDCLHFTPQEDLNKFGGKCEECFEDKE